MRKYSVMAAAIQLLWLAAPSPSHAERTVMTCEGWKDCVDLRTVCAKGAYGQVDYPDGSIWGICVI